MNQPTPRPRPWPTIAGGAAALGACALCCAGPILAFLGGLSVVSLAGALWIPALAILAVAALAAAVWLLRRRNAGSCRTENAGPIDLGIPTPAARPNDRAGTAGPRR
jgi:hypothetical protein